MTYTAITLTDPVSGISVPIMPVDGVSASSLDVSAPARQVVQDRVGGHGSYDTTRLLSAGAVALSLLLYPTPAGAQPELFLDQLGQLLDPALRCILTVSNDQWAGDRQITVAFDSKAAPVSDPSNTPVQINWRATSALWEGTVLQQAFVPALVQSNTGIVIGTGGLTITTGGLVIAPSTAPSDTLATNTGAASVQWSAFLYGPCTGPKLANDSVGPPSSSTVQSSGQKFSNDTSIGGLTIEFTDDVDLAAGDYVALDSSTHQALLNSDPSQPVTQFINFATSDWWLLAPGVNQLRYYPTAAGAGAMAAVSFRPAWFL